MEKLNKNKVGLTLGLFSAFLHLIWSFLVYFEIADNLISKWYTNHFVSLTITITEFSFTKAILLILQTFITGFIIGWLFAFIYNKINKGK